MGRFIQSKAVQYLMDSVHNFKKIGGNYWRASQHLIKIEAGFLISTGEVDKFSCNHHSDASEDV